MARRPLEKIETLKGIAPDHLASARMRVTEAVEQQSSPNQAARPLIRRLQQRLKYTGYCNLDSGWMP
jgi:hypothetical protein